jgi:hypothetical protein
MWFSCLFGAWNVRNLMDTLPFASVLVAAVTVLLHFLFCWDWGTVLDHNFCVSSLSLSEQ